MVDLLNAGASIVDAIDESVDIVLSGGKSDSQNRADNQVVNCPSVKPGYTEPKPGDPALTVTISPNSPQNKATSAKPPNVIAIGTGVIGPLFDVNLQRKGFAIQNNGTNNIYVLFDIQQQAVSPIYYHFKIVPGETLNDGIWKGRVDVVADAISGGSMSILEMQ